MFPFGGFELECSLVATSSLEGCSVTRHEEKGCHKAIQGVWGAPPSTENQHDHVKVVLDEHSSALSAAFDYDCRLLPGKLKFELHALKSWQLHTSVTHDVSSHPSTTPGHYSPSSFQP